MPEIEFIVVCDECGRELEADIEMDVYNRKIVVKTEVCPSCKKEEDD